MGLAAALDAGGNVSRIGCRDHQSSPPRTADVDDQGVVQGVHVLVFDFEFRGRIEPLEPVGLDEIIGTGRAARGQEDHCQDQNKFVTSTHTFSIPFGAQ